MKFSIFVLCLLALAACGGPQSGSPASERPSSEVSLEESSSSLRLSAGQQTDWGIVVAPVTEQEVRQQLSLLGIIAVNQNRTAHISSLVEGKAAGVMADLGDEVHRGSVLATINSPHFSQTQADFLRARAALTLIRTEYARAERLYEEQAIEEKELLRRRAEMDKQATEYGVLGSKLHSLGITHDQIEALIKRCEAIDREDELCEMTDPFLPLLSPLSGTVIFRDVVMGENTDPKKTLFIISDLGRPWALLDAHEKDLPDITADSPVTILASAYPDREFTGTVTTISDVVDEKLRTVKVRVEVDNGGGWLKPNMYIQGIVQTSSSHERALVVPEDAVQNLEGQKVVFISDEEGVFSARIVETGERVESGIVVTRGLQPGERIVVKGSFTIKSELTKSSAPDSHAH